MGNNQLKLNTSIWVNLITKMSNNTSERRIVNFIFMQIFIVFIGNKNILEGKEIIDSKFRIIITSGGGEEVKTW